MKSNTNTRNNVWEKRLDMSKDDKYMQPSKQTIDDVDEKINRLENDNFNLTMNSQREGIKSSGQRLQTT